jgi:hypothetical protein
MIKLLFPRGFVADIASSLRQYCRDDLNEGETNRLVKISAGIAQKRLWGKINAAARIQGTTIEQQALSLMSGLFKGEGISPLKSALKGHLESTDVDLFLRFQAVVLRSASQELFHRWGESDPLGARLWRNLNRALRHDNRLIVFPNDKPRWVALAETQNLRQPDESVYAEELGQIISDLRVENNNLADIASEALKIIINETRFQHALKIDVLFTAIRNMWSESILRELADVKIPVEADPTTDMIKQQGKKLAADAVNEKLRRLSDMGRISRDELESFNNALNDLIEDIADGGPAQSYFRYLYSHRPGIDNKEYRKKYRTRFEYLAEIAQQSFTEEIKRQMIF